jgi:ABC-type molybdate transport system substrate-binding protein
MPQTDPPHLPITFTQPSHSLDFLLPSAAIARTPAAESPALNRSRRRQFPRAARDAQKANASLQNIAVPEPLAASADYGLTVMNDVSPAAYQFALFILSTEGQRILASYGFSAPN